MNPRRKSRLYLAIVVLIGIGLTSTLVLYALRSNIDLFYTPGEILQGKGERHEKPEIGQRLRIGGMVMPGSVKRDDKTLEMSFQVYDARGAVTVTYTVSCQTCSARGRGWWRKGYLLQVMLLMRKKYWQNMMRNTHHRKSRKR